MISQSHKLIIAMVSSFMFISFSSGYSLAAPPLTDEKKAEIFSKISSLPVPFIENKGLIAGQNTKYYASIFNGTIFVSNDGSVTYVLPKNDKVTRKGWTIKENLLEAVVTSPSGTGEVSAKINSLIGKYPLQWQKNIIGYSSINFGEVFKGIQEEITAYGDHVAKNFHIRAGADSCSIKIKVAGANGLTITDNGELTLQTGLGALKLPKPTAYQEDNGTRKYIDVAYAVTGDSYGFKVDTYDSSKELIIAATFQERLSDNYADNKSIAIAVDGNGNIFATGKDAPSECPQNPGPCEISSIGSSGLFVAKFDINLQNLLAVTFLGGSGTDEAHALAIDGAGAVFVAGSTDSADFPAIPGSYNTSYSGAGDSFVAKLDNNLQVLLAATFLGGSDSDDATSIDIDDSSFVYVGGTTSSLDFPWALNTSDSILASSAQPFTVRFDNNLTVNLSAQISATGSSTSSGSGNGNGVPGTPGSTASVPGAGGTNQDGGVAGTSVSNQGNSAQIAGPGWFMGKAKPVSHEQAKAYFDAKLRESATSTTTAPLALTGITPLSATSSSPEITELARALRYDPKLIYDYVHNHIDYVPYFGSLKGATLTYLDGSGNDFDQASLMIALLRASGYTAQYVYGQMTIPGDQMANWLGTDQVWQVVSSVVASGGIPLETIYTDAMAILDRVWIKATINSVDYLFDPAFKSYSYTTKINLGTAMSYNQSEFLTAALTGATVGSDYIQNVNETNLRTKLATYSTNLVNTIRNQYPYPNKAVEEIVGGRSIVQTNLTQYSTTLPFSPVVTYIWDDIPVAYMDTVRIQHAGIDYTFNTPDLSGKRLTLTYAGTDHHPELRQDGTLVASGTATTLGSTYSFTLTINHPYAALGGTYMDQTATYNLTSGSTYAVISDFGGVSDALVQKRQQQLGISQAQGLSSTSEAVLGETLNLMGLSWLREVQLTDQLLSKLADTVSITHHRLGLVAQGAQGAQWASYYIDLRAIYNSFISKHNTSADEVAHFKALTHATSGFEHAILEQMMGLNKPGVSTIKLLQIANATGRKVFIVTSANFAAVQSQLVNYSSSDITTLQGLVNSGYTLILPDNGQLVLNQWKGKGYIYENNDFMGMMIGGGYFGGYASTTGQIDVSTLASLITNNINVGLQSLTVFISTSKDPVNMATGAFVHEHNDLALGADAPLGLSFSRSYDSGNNLAQRTLGYGWTHNYDIYLTPTSDGEPGLGARQPVDTASFITALYVNLDLFKAQDNITGWITTALTSKWGADQLIDNAVTAHFGNKAMEFIKLADGTYASPPGITSQLIKNGDGTYSILERFGKRMNFDASMRISQLTDADANPLTFLYTGNNLTTVRDPYNRTLTLTYTNSRLTSVTDSTNRIVQYGYNANGELNSYTDPENKPWGFGYDLAGSHRMTTLTNPLTITTATNGYDSLGRVITQTVPRQGPPGTTATYNFYFSGFRNVEEDPAGHTTTYYYDDKRREYALENPLEQKSVKQFDGQNHTVLATDPRLNSTSYSYDGNNNLSSITNSLLNPTTFVYDTQFRLTDINDTLLHNTHFDYNATHHRTLTRDNLGNTFQATYNWPKGLKDTATDGRTTQTVFTYDGFGNPQTAKTAAHPLITYVYDTIGRMTSLTDQVNSQTTFEYDKRNLVKTITDPSRTYSTGFVYYDDGRLWTKTDRNNRTTTYTYTPSGKPDTITYSNSSTLRFTYNNLDQLTDMQDTVGHTGYGYDAAGRPNSVTNPYNSTVSALYDAAGNLTELTYPGNKKVIYTYDELNRLHTVKIDWLASKPVATYNYKNQEPDLLDNLVQFNGIVTGYSFDTAHRLTGITSPVATYSFPVLDGNGNRQQLVQTEPLTQTLAQSMTGYGYNDKKNRLVTAGTNSFGYDNEGELNSGYDSSYTFDHEHRFTGFSGASYSYDGSGNRLQAVRSGVTTRYIYDMRGNLLAEADGNNNITRYYIYGKGLMAMVTPAGQVYNYHYNATGSTIALTDQNQAMVNKYAYDPFGNVGNQVEAVPQPFKYVGQHGVIAESNGFYYMKARYYDPRVGRFVSEDPIGFAGGNVNLSAYVQNNPVNLVDSLGLWAAGASLDISTINPFTSGDGGTYGINLEYTSSGGWHVYYYNTPNDQGSFGLDAGGALTFNFATGSGDWTGDFDSYNGSYGLVTGGFFHSPLEVQEGGYFGYQAGWALGTPGIGYTRTNYKKLF